MHFFGTVTELLGFLAASSGSVVKNLPAMQETQVQSLGQEAPLQEEMATHFSILAWEPTGRGSLVGYSTWGCRVGYDLATTWQK